MKMVQSFSELKKEAMPYAGGKGGTLALLYQAGYPIPDGFVIMPPAFSGGRLRKEAWENIEAYLAEMWNDTNKVSFAVRSSALSEDSASASFAGEFETVLGVNSTEGVYEAIHKVQNSKQSERVYEYSKAKGINTGHEIAIVVQRLINADFAGVLFTADPISGNRLQMIGNYVCGLGERLVSGEANPETFRFTSPKGAYEGPDEVKFIAKQLYRIARQLEKVLRHPQDIEWAVEGRKLYILQSRPITTLIAHNPGTGEWNDSLTGDYLWSKVNLSEAVPDVMTPCTWSILQHEIVAGQVFEIPGNHPIIGNICGRPYFNFGLLISFPVALGMKKQIILKQAEETYGSIPEGLEIPILPLPASMLLTGIISGKVKLLWNRRSIKKDLHYYLSMNPSWCCEFRERIRGIKQADTLVSLWNTELEPQFTRSCVFLKYGMDKIEPIIKLRNKLEKLVGKSDANMLLSNLCGKSGYLASLGPVIGLSRIAAGKMSESEYIELYGHRSEHEVELSIPRPAENPGWLSRMLENYMQSGVNADILLDNQRKEFEAAWNKFKSRYPGKVKSIRSEISKAAAGAQLRENIRSEYTRVLWAAREFALKAGDLTGLADKIFFLSFPEILEVLSGNKNPIAIIPARQETYARYCALPTYPAIIRGSFDPFKWASDPERRSDIYTPDTPGITLDTDTIKGFAGAPGIVVGKVRCLNSPDEIALLQKSEILVTTTTNIGWTPLFPKAAAIVTDVGAPLSHAAIVARELGIPAVVGCCNATTRLHTGDRIEVNGSTGSVKILESA